MLSSALPSVLVKKEEIKEEPQDEGVFTPPIHTRGEITSEHLTHRLVHRCEYCEFSSLTDDKLTAHRESKHKIYLCRFCKTEFTSKFSQHKHFVTCDKLLAMRKKVKAQVEEIQDRKSTHISIRCMLQKVKCPICKKIFESMFEMGDKSHICKSYAVRLYACSGCKAQFTTANGLKSHLISKYTEKDFKCFDTGTISFESMKIPKYTRHACHITSDASNHNPVTLQLVPIKSEPTDKDEMHDDRMKHALVAAHLLSDHDGSITVDYYNAMRKMMLKVDCPFCGIQCRTHAALHSHGLVHHPPHERCLYQCGGCHLTYQTPTGLGQHIKREYDLSNVSCYNQINLVRKQDYLGPVTGWNKKNKGPAGPVRPPCGGGGPFMRTIDVKPDPHFDEDKVKKEEPDDIYSTNPYPEPSHSARAPAPNSILEYQIEFVPKVPHNKRVKEEPITEIKQESA